MKSYFYRDFSVIEDREIWACASLILHRYGDAAGLHAAERADELLEAGDHEGCRTWIRIGRRIAELENTEPGDVTH